MTTEKNLPPTIAEALVAFQADLPRVQKGSRNEHFRSSYADLADVVGVVLPALARQGLSWVTVPTMTPTGFALLYTLQHVSGDQIEGSWPLPNPAETTPQAVGSALTYARRYALSAVTGVAPDEDDDGNRAAKASPPEGWKKLIAEASTIDALTAIYKRAVRDNWASEQVLAALNARRAVLTPRTGAHAPRAPQTPVEGEGASPSASPTSPSTGPTEQDYEAAVAAEFDAAVARGEVTPRD